jgi:single-stranded DNA-specific DHH superfamily exonuclease
MGTTLGALVRSAWIDSEVIKDEQGTTSERWFVTDAGKHAMQLFDIKLEQDRKKEEAAAEINKIREAQRKQQAELTQAAEKAIIEYYMLYKKLTQVVNDKWRVTTKAAMHAGMDKSKFNRLCEIAKHQAGRDDHNEEPF